MAKKKLSIDLSAQNLYFEIQKVRYKLLRFHPHTMTIDISSVENRDDSLTELPFAHLSKELKKIIKPN